MKGLAAAAALLAAVTAVLWVIRRPGTVIAAVWLPLGVVAAAVTLLITLAAVLALTVAPRVHTRLTRSKP